MTKETTFSPPSSSIFMSEFKSWWLSKDLPPGCSGKSCLKISTVEPVADDLPTWPCMLRKIRETACQQIWSRLPLFRRAMFSFIKAEQKDLQKHCWAHETVRRTWLEYPFALPVEGCHSYPLRFWKLVSLRPGKTFHKQMLLILQQPLKPKWASSSALKIWASALDFCWFQFHRDIAGDGHGACGFVWPSQPSLEARTAIGESFGWDVARRRPRASRQTYILYMCRTGWSAPSGAPWPSSPKCRWFNPVLSHVIHISVKPLQRSL